MSKKATMPREKALEVLRDKDRDINLIGLKSGSYLIDGEIVLVSGYSHDIHYVTCKDVGDVRLVYNNTLVTRYEDAAGNEMTVEEYNITRERLSKLSDNSLEDEYAYKKFKRRWNEIRKTVQEISDPIKVRVLESDLLIDNNPNIYSLIYTNDNDETMYMYERANTIKELLREEVKVYRNKFDKYLKKFNVDFKLKEKNDLRYIELCENYIFGSQYSFGLRKGPKSLIEDLYNRDKSMVNTRIAEIFELALPIKVNGILFEQKIIDAKANAKSQETLDFINEIESIVKGHASERK